MEVFYMFKYENSETGKTTVQKLWDYYSDVNKWHLWDKGIKSVDLFGSFDTTANGVMNMLDGSALPFSITECTPNKSFTTQSKLGNIVVTFGHELKENGDTVTITHTVTIEGGNDMQMEGMGKAIVAGIPECMQRLIAL